ncbi:unnamed protein product, partial [Iphiclides podalirius]
MVRNAKSTAFAAVSGYSLRTLKIQVRDVRGDVAPVRTHIRSRSPRIGSEDRGVSGLDGKRMRPVPGLVDARASLGACGLNPDPRSGPPRSFSLAVRSRLFRFVRDRRARPTNRRSKRSAQNWHGRGEYDWLIKTKHCDGPRGC